MWATPSTVYCANLLQVALLATGLRSMSVFGQHARALGMAQLELQGAVHGGSTSPQLEPVIAILPLMCAQCTDVGADIMPSVQQ